MRTLLKLTTCTLMLFSFTACFPVLMVPGEGGHGRWYYNNHYYNTRYEYREARRHHNDYDRDDRRPRGGDRDEGR